MNAPKINRGTLASVALQCICPDSGEEGTFLFVTDNHRTKGTRVSPVCTDMAALCQWCASNGWKGVGGRFHKADMLSNADLGKIMLKEAGEAACQSGYGTTDPEWVGHYALQYGDIRPDGTLN